MKRRSPLFWILALSSLAAACWWTLRVPHRPEQLYRAIPAEATLLSAHYNLSARWKAVAGNPLIASVAGALGVEESSWRSLDENPEFHRLLRWLADDDVFVAYVPRMRTTGEPAWVFASWVDGHSQRLRWLLKSAKAPELRRAASRNGWPVWVWAPRGMKHGERITFALVEGMAVGCIAKETLGIDHVLACVDGHAPSLAGVRALVLDEPSVHTDRGWVKPMPADGALQEPLFYNIELLSSGGLAGTVVTPYPPAATGAVVSVQAVDDAAGLLGDHPIAYAVMDRDLGRYWLAELLTNAMGREARDLLAGQGPGALTLSLLGGPHSGRFMAVRLPALVAGVTVDDPAQTKADIPALLDRVNARTRWGLVPQPVPVGTQEVFAIEGTGRSVYASLATDERVAYTTVGNSLVVASNLGTLSKLLSERPALAGGGGRLRAGAQRMREGHASGYLWIDLVKGGQVLRLAVTAWSLKLLVEDAGASQAQRQQLNELKAWIDALAPFEQLQLWVRPRGEGTEFEFKVGAT